MTFFCPKKFTSLHCFVLLYRYNVCKWFAIVRFMNMQNVYHIHTIYRVFTKKYLQICRGTYRLHGRCTHLFSLNCNMHSPWQLHTSFWLSKPITAQSLGPCKWWPLWSPFASALTTGWYQSHWRPSGMRMAPLYKRAGSPALGLTFGWMWPRSHLDLNLDTSRRHSPDCWFTQQSLVNLSIHLSTYTWQPARQP